MHVYSRGRGYLLETKLTWYFGGSIYCVFFTAVFDRVRSAGTPNYFCQFDILSGGSIPVICSISKTSYCHFHVCCNVCITFRFGFYGAGCQCLHLFQKYLWNLLQQRISFIRIMTFAIVVSMCSHDKYFWLNNDVMPHYSSCIALFIIYCAFVSQYFYRIDAGLNEHKFILPGIGDFGDLYFGTNTWQFLNI